MAQTLTPTALELVELVKNNSQEDGGNGDTLENNDTGYTQENNGTGDTQENTGTCYTQESNGTGDTEENNGTGDTQEKNGTEGNQVGDSSNNSQENNCTGGTQENNGTSDSQENNGTGASQENNDTEGSQEKNGTGDTQENNGTGDTQENNGTEGNQVGDSSDNNQENNCTGGTQENNGTSDSQENNGTGDTQENNGTGASQENNDTGASQENNGTGASQENNGTGDTQENKGTGDTQENNGTGDTQENKGTGDTQENNGTGDTPENYGTGDTQENNGISDNQGNNGTDDTLENNGTGDTQENKGTGDTQEYKSSCDSQENNGTDDSQVDDGAYDSQADDGAYDSEVGDGTGDGLKDSCDKKNEELTFNGTHETQVSEGGEEHLRKHLVGCTKNPGHTHFIPLNEFNINHLSQGNRDSAILEYVKATADLTVRVDVKMTSTERPEFLPNTTVPYAFYDMRGRDIMRTATGMLVEVYKVKEEGDNGTCQCRKCQHSGAPSKVRGEVRMRTATQVVFDDLEAKHTTCRLFYDGHDSPLVTLDGWMVDEADVEEDRCLLKCATCDVGLLDKLIKLERRWDDLGSKVTQHYESSRDEKRLVFIVSHPHGCPKQVSVGHWTKRYVMGDDRTKYTYTTCTCPGSSGAYVHLLGCEVWMYYYHHVHSGVNSEGKNFSSVGRENL